MVQNSLASPQFFAMISLLRNSNKKLNFSIFFANQCSLINNNSKIPADSNLLADKFLSNVTCTTDETVKIISGLNPNKAQGYDIMSIRMIGVFPDVSKKVNIVPLHTKNDNKAMQNYWPFSLLSVSGKILERLLCNSMFLSLLKTTWYLQINQSLSITYDTYQSFYDSWEERSVFFIYFKTFDKVWHKGFKCNLKCNGLSGNMLTIMNKFLNSRYQRAVPSGQNSKWTPVNTVVPQGLMLELLLLLIYI